MPSRARFTRPGAAPAPWTSLLPAALAAGLGLLGAGLAAAPAAASGSPATLAIVAADPEAGEVGVAALSAAPAALADIGWARAGVGAVAVLGRPDRGAALRVLDFLSQGVPPPAALEALLAEDPDPQALQVALAGPGAITAAQSGASVAPWKGHLQGKTYAVAGRGAAGEKVILAMGVAFEPRGAIWRTAFWRRSRPGSRRRSTGSGCARPRCAWRAPPPRRPPARSRPSPLPPARPPST